MASSRSGVKAVSLCNHPPRARPRCVTFVPSGAASKVPPAATSTSALSRVAASDGRRTGPDDDSDHVSDAGGETGQTNGDQKCRFHPSGDRLDEARVVRPPNRHLTKITFAPADRSACEGETEQH